MPYDRHGKPDVGLSLALAVVSSSTAPLLLLDGDMAVIAASNSFCQAFGIDADSIAGQPLMALGAGAWNVPQLRSLMAATIFRDVEIEAYEMDLNSAYDGVRRLVLNAHKLSYDDGAPIRILLSVSDVTAARIAEKLKEEMLREKAVLLQEVQHRVANSLQIIASVLLQSARRVQSEETRKHLRDAHQRVMSVASLQKQLASSQVGEVQLRPYLTDLCKTIGASMIRDPEEMTLDVVADDSLIDADVSVSLGLIVTELVINALKHAFPDQLSGKIRVGFLSQGDDWTLSVRDNGIGMLANSAKTKPGLGTSIVVALANQLNAGVQVSDAGPGAIVSIVHRSETSLH